MQASWGPLEWTDILLSVYEHQNGPSLGWILIDEIGLLRKYVRQVCFKCASGWCYPYSIIFLINLSHPKNGLYKFHFQASVWYCVNVQELYSINKYSPTGETTYDKLWGLHQTSDHPAKYFSHQSWCIKLKMSSMHHLEDTILRAFRYISIHKLRSFSIGCPHNVHFTKFLKYLQKQLAFLIVTTLETNKCLGPPSWFGLVFQWLH